MPDGALSDLTVIEVGEGLAGAFAGKAFADFGADVIKVEPPAGDPSRRHGPFPGDEPHREKSGQFLYLNANKRSVTLDLSCFAGRQALSRLTGEADVLITDMAPRELAAIDCEPAQFLADKPRLTWTAITTFGLSGPYRDYKGADLIGWHVGGTGSGTPFNAVTDLAEPPIRGGGNQTEYLTGWTAAAATMVGVFYRAACGMGQVIDVSRVESVANMMRPSFALYSYDRSMLPADRTKAGSPWIYPCRDGHISTSHLREHWWTNLKELMGSPEWAASEAFASSVLRRANADALDPQLAEWFANYTRAELYPLLQSRGIPCFPVHSVAEMLEAPQYVDRGVIVDQHHPVAGTIRQPGASIRYSETPWRLRRPAPLLGEHNAEVFGPLGITGEQFGSATGAPVPARNAVAGGRA
jgi:crotonobetainyl-CoA:carnitine CoA-transferase CaiB-like acyl-CoA transferase